jgi:hypothetical protein
MKRNVSVQLSNRELWLLTASIDTDIKDRKRSDPYSMGVLDPDREPELQELTDLHDKLYEALIRSGG